VYGFRRIAVPATPVRFQPFAAVPNIDRLWDVWTRKQIGFGLPTGPSAQPAPNGGPSDLKVWSSEPFLFYVDAEGQPVDKTRAGDYAEIGEFDYEYEPGSGEEVVPKLKTLGTTVRDTRTFSASIAKTGMGMVPVTATVRIPEPVLLRSLAGNAPRLFARIVLALSAGWNSDFVVLVNSPTLTDVRNFADPDFVGTLSIFGHHHHMGNVSFLLPLSTSLAVLRKQGQLNATVDVTLHVIPILGPEKPRLQAQAFQLKSVAVEQH
jgi:tyrosinase